MRLPTVFVLSFYWMRSVADSAWKSISASSARGPTTTRHHLMLLIFTHDAWCGGDFAFSLSFLFYGQQLHGQYSSYPCNNACWLAGKARHNERQMGWETTVARPVPQINLEVTVFINWQAYLISFSIFEEPFFSLALSMAMAVDGETSIWKNEKKTKDIRRGWKEGSVCHI